jgi:para-aminobenzoate synthetase component 1
LLIWSAKPLQNFFTIDLPYTEDLQSHYHALHMLPGFILLESSDPSRGRYDVLSAYPYERLVIDRQNMHTAFESLQALLPKSPSLIDLPFQGGALGFVSYDLGAALAGIDVFSQSCIHDVPLMDMGFYDWAIIADHLLKKVTLFARNEKKDTEWIVKEVQVLWQNPVPVNHITKLKATFQSVTTKAQYQEAILSIHADLTRGRSYQVNYTQPFCAEYSGEPWDIYRTVTAHNPIPFGGYMQSSSASILSFSPERFLQIDNQDIFTSPIKGTVRASNCPIEDKKLQEQLMQCTKNRAENVMIVDLLRNDLGQIAKPGSVQVSNLCALQSFRGLHHLVSDIKATCLDDMHPVQVFKACFPGGSITGAPKLEAMRIIGEQESYRRGVYCGSVGYFSFHGRHDSNIAIRTITAKNHLLQLAAGGGIVMDSVCEEEYLECLTKIEAILRPLTN